MIDDKTLNKFIDLLESIKLSESFSAMRHLPTEQTLNLKRKLRKQLERLPLNEQRYFYVLVKLGEEAPSDAHLTHFVRQELKHPTDYQLDDLLRKENLIDALLKGQNLIQKLPRDWLLSQFQ